jgi:hypothetical protein
VRGSDLRDDVEARVARELLEETSSSGSGADGEGDEPPASAAAEPVRRKLPIGAGLGVLALLLLIVAVLASRCDRELATTDQGDPQNWLRPMPREIDRPGIRTALHGKVLRELPLDGEAETPVAKPAPTDDPALDQLLAALEPWTLEPPLPGSCRARAWQGAALVGAEVECGSDGSYALELTPDTSGVVHVELSIDGHLRGLLDVEIDAGGEALVELATVALGPGHRVAGQTVDARGEPLAGVRVQALPRPNLGEEVPWRTTSDADGSFEFTTLPYGPVSLRAIKDGYALSVVEAISPEDAVLMILDALIDLEGEVVGDPELLARAIVRLEGSSVWPALERSLDEAGHFVFERLPDGIYGVEVTVPPERPGEQEYASVPLENVTPDLHVAVALVPAFRVPVRVVDPSGDPIPDARVTLGYSQIGMLQKIAETDGEGRARVGPVVPGPYYVQVDADGFLPPEPLAVEVGPEGFVGTEQVLVMIRPAKLEGIVVDEDDRPVAGAEVWLDSDIAFSVGEGASRRQLFAVAIGASEGSLGVTRGDVPDIPLFADETEGSLGAVITNKDGRFEIDLLLPGTHRIWATHGGHAASAVERFELRSGEVRGGVRLLLREGRPLTGVVRSPNGQPIAGVQIDLGDGMLLVTDERGVFDAGFRRGRQELILRAPGMIPKAVEIDLGTGAGPGVDLDLELEPALGRFEGRVLDGNNQPIADVEVLLRPLDKLSPTLITWTDARGIYEFDQLSPGKVEISFEHPDYVAMEDKAAVDERAGLRHEIVLDPGWSATVLVRSVGRGEPIVGATARAGGVTAITDKTGVARLVRLVGNKLRLEVSAPGWVDERLQLRDDGSHNPELIVELSEAGSISGTIDDDIGDPVVGAIIQVRSRSGTILGEARSDGSGRWRVDGVRPGDVIVRADPPPALSAVLAPARGESDVLRGEVTTDVRLRFDRL